MGAFESGSSFIAGVLAKLPETQRSAAQAIFDAAEAKDAVVLLGDGVLARSDYSKHMDTLRDKEVALNQHYETLTSWYDVNKSALEEARDLKLRSGGGTPHPQPTPTPTPSPSPTPSPDLQSPALSAADVRKLADDAVNEAGRDYVAVSAYIASIAAQHQAMFGEPLNALELVQNPKVGRPIVGQPGRIFSLQDAYLERYGEAVGKKQQEAQDKRFNDEVERRLGERQKQTTSHHPFPLRAESSPLDVLETKEGPAAHTLDSAVAEYERLQAARGS
jgi:hypothetical protein